MARIVPDETDAARTRGTARAELETLDALERDLPDDLTVFHGVHWARADDGGSVYGEIDFLVVNRYGRILAIEQKNGRIERVGDELVKTYATGPKSIRAQVTRNIGHLRGEFGRRHPGRRLDVDHLLYCPDDDVGGRLPVGIDPDRVVDARTARFLADRIRTLFDRRPMPEGTDAADPTDVHAFLCEQVEVVPDVDALRELARTEYRRLSGGLSTWARRLKMTPFRLRAVGTAGSGKTQLALQELQACHTGGGRALYVCFNRPLAERMRAVAPADARIATFHELGTRRMKAHGIAIDWRAPGVFDRIAEQSALAAAELRGTFDTLVVDEGQDFAPSWVAPLLDTLHPQGRALWLEDPDQNLYRREPVPLPGWVVLESPVNHRSPRTVATLIEMLGLADRPIESGSAVHGFDPGLSTYDDDASLLARTDEAVGALLAAGHAPADIAVLTWHGLGKSALGAAAHIAGVATRRFEGRYTEDGNALYTDGALTVETVHRFKGGSADCVVIVGIDFDAWSDDVRRRLFVAMTRARLKLHLVVSPSAETRIVERLAG